VKILFIAPQPFFRERGTPIRTRHQLHVLGEMGYRVDLVCYPFGVDVDIPGVRIFRTMRLPGIRDVPVGPSLAKIPMDLIMFIRAFFLCLREGYDVIQAVEEAAFFGVILKKIFRTRFVYNMDSHISDQLSYTKFLTVRPLLALVRCFERWTMRNASYVVSVCQALTDVVRQYAPGARVVQLEDSPMYEQFVEDPAGARRIRERYGLGDAPVVLYAGNFISYQGVNLLLESARLVLLERPEVRFVLVGGEPHQLAEKKAMIADLGIAAQCVCTGKQPTYEIKAFASAANYLVSPRVGGTNTPLKIYDYMQSGRPIVATRLRTHTQVLDDTCAILTEPTPEGFARGLLEVIRDPARGEAVAREARRRLDDRYSLRIMREKARVAYHDLAASLQPTLPPASAPVKSPPPPSS
jgi:glycosyltransferase involved in cell wall biosynthesis